MSEALCWICQSKPPCASIELEGDGKLWLTVPARSEVGNEIKLRYEVVPPPQPEIFSMPHKAGEICDACVRGYAGVGMLVYMPPCPTCNGSGIIVVMDRGQDWTMDGVRPCPTCCR